MEESTKMEEGAKKVSKALMDYFMAPILKYVDTEKPILKEDKIKLIQEVGDIIMEGVDYISEKIEKEIPSTIYQMHGLYEIESKNFPR